MENDEIIVDSKVGKIKGIYVKSFFCEGYYSFVSVPYAEKPIGILRFMPPVTLKPQYGIYDATKFKQSCIEDVLQLAVHTPTIDKNAKLPVMFWVGSFHFDNNPQFKVFGPSYLMNENVIVVHCNYRRGPFGFLSICEICAPGNCGLKDVVMALKWVQNNIESFGGDKDNVTLCGYASGGCVAQYMLLSPMATGLFHKVIMTMASALSSMAVCSNPTKRTINFAQKYLNITSDDPYDIIEQLKLLPAEVIQNPFGSGAKDYGLYGFKDFMLWSFTPCIENDYEGQSSFLTKHPLVALKLGDINCVPIIIGSNKIENQSNRYVFGKDVNILISDLNENINKMVPDELVLDMKSLKAKNVGKKVKDFYMNGQDVTEKNLYTYIQYFYDYNMLYYMNLSVRLHCKYSTVYYYIFDHYNNTLEGVNDIGYIIEMLYLFQYNNNNRIECEIEKLIRKRLIKLYTNFAKYSKPMTEEYQSIFQVMWEPVNSSVSLNYLNIGIDLTLGINPMYERMKFWDELIEDSTAIRVLKQLQR